MAVNDILVQLFLLWTSFNHGYK